MNTWNKVLVGLIFVMSLVFFYFGARALKTHQAWRDSVNKQEAALAQVAKQKEDIFTGTEASPGIRPLQLAMQKLTAGRGRVWPSAMPAPNGFNPANGQLAVAFQVPTPPPYEKDSRKMQLFLFQEPTQQDPVGAYLGEFTITGVTAQSWALEPSRALTPERMRTIQQSRGPWIMYEVMPAPSRNALALNQASPPSPAPAPEAAAGAEPSPSDAAGEAKKAEAKPAAEPNAGKLAQYQDLFNELDRQRMLLQDLIAAAEADKLAVDDAHKAALQRTEDLKKDIESLKVELAKSQAARDAVAAHRAALEAKVKELRGAIVTTIKLNREAAAELAQIQLEGVRRANERIKMARIDGK